MNIRADRVLTKLLIELWDPTKVVFKFVDCELTPTLEEVTSFTELPSARWNPILSVIMSGHRFLHAQGLRSNKNLRNIEDGWMSLDLLFDIFWHREGYDLHL